MPHIDVTMRMSRRREVAKMLVKGLRAREVATGLSTVTGDISNAKNTFSSWDSCMNKNYCKWPVIIAIVVVSLIALWIVTCIVRCAKFGYSCCCCPSCCCGVNKNKIKHSDNNNNSGTMVSNLPYARPMPMSSGGPPQFAQFEVGKNGLVVSKPVSEDALPPMPSWDIASKKHVVTEVQKNTVEMGDLYPTTGQKLPLMSGANSSAPSSPGPGQTHSLYVARSGQGMNGNGYMSVPNQSFVGVDSSHHGSPGLSPQSPPGYGQPNRQPSSNEAFLGAAQSQSPNQHFNNFPNRFPHQPQREYSNSSPRPSYNDRYYSHISRQHSPIPVNTNTGFDFGPSIRGCNPASTYNQPYSPPPQQYNITETTPPSYATNSPPPQQQQQGEPVYPGYRPYQPVRRDTGNPTNGALGQGAVSGWDPVQR